jgi:hypothetical protein
VVTSGVFSCDEEELFWEDEELDEETFGKDEEVVGEVEVLGLVDEGVSVVELKGDSLLVCPQEAKPTINPAIAATLKIFFINSFLLPLFLLYLPKY